MHTESLSDKTIYFNYTLKEANTFKLFCCETPGLKLSMAVPPDFRFSSSVNNL